MRKIKKPTPTDDSVSPSWVKPFSIEQIPAVTKFLPILESIRPEDLARIVKPPESTQKAFAAKQQQTDDGVYWEANIGNPEYHPVVHEFLRACYDHGLIQPFNWPAWVREGRRYMNDPRLVASARLATCIKLITASIRYERFCDGHLGEVIKSGHIAAILRRLKQLTDARLETTKALRDFAHS
jgi:Family of unknown function (DUF6508)